jgi:hypothetical protein
MTQVDTSADAINGSAALLRASMTPLLHSERLKMAGLIKSLAAERDALAQKVAALDAKAYAQQANAINAAAERDAATAEAARLRGAWLRVIQSENYCNPSGAECQAKRCGCAKEMELYISDHDAAFAQKDAGHE